MAQVLTFLQLQGSIKYGWYEKYPIIIILASIPSGWLFLKSVQHFVLAFNGEIWPSRLIGSPPGYVGHDEGGQLTEQVKNKPYSVVLFDEIEKAHKDIFSTLLQLLDDGHITDSLGRKINFKNCLIIMTSNIGVKRLQDFGAGVGFKTGKSEAVREEEKREILKKELSKFFAPEFLNRIDDVVIFNSLEKKHR